MWGCQSGNLVPQPIAAQLGGDGAQKGGPGREGFALRRAKLLYSRDSKWK
jgi:hypothetical protein